jgi:hypothetical protein
MLRRMRKKDDKRTVQPDRQIDPLVFKLYGQTKEAPSLKN